MGSNDGYWVRRFQSATGAYRAPWCMSFLQYVIRNVLGYTIADGTAGVFYCVGWARKHGLLKPVAEPGLLVAFLWGAGHIGIVESVNGDSMTTIEGNAANSVLRRTRPARGDYAFILVPGTTDAPPPKPKPKYVPRFQVITSENGHTVVRVGWSKWAVVQQRFPRILARYRSARIRRKVVLNK